MKFRSHCLFAAVVVTAIALVTTPVKAHADTYQIFDLGPDMSSAGSTSVYGITASGAVVLVENLHVGVPQCANSGICTEYETWVNGVMLNESPTAPSLMFDNGTPCTPTLSFSASNISSGICNNGHEVYTATPVGQPGVFGPESFDGPNITDSFAGSPPFISEVDLNSSGDFTIDFSHAGEGPNGGELAEAVDLSSTPEPGSIFLLGTGLLAMGTMWRGRPGRQES